MTNLLYTMSMFSNLCMSAVTVSANASFSCINGDYLEVRNHYSNIVHTITVTNEYRPKQYKQVHYNLVFPMQSVETWVDTDLGMIYSESRDNPDKKIVEVWKHWYIKFVHNGKDYDLEFDKELLDKKVYARKVETKEEWSEDK